MQTGTDVKQEGTEEERKNRGDFPSLFPTVSAQCSSVLRTSAVPCFSLEALTLKEWQQQDFSN